MTNPKSTDEVPLTFRQPRPQREAVTALADSERRSLGAMTSILVGEALAARKKGRRS